jgi:hypothetical protein
MTPAVASATVHSGHIVFTEPKSPPSIGEPGPPADQQNEYEHEVLVRYDASAGSLTIEDEVWDPSYWGEETADDFAIGPSCGTYQLDGGFRARPKYGVNQYGQRVELHYPGPEGGPSEGGSIAGWVTLEGYAGEVTTVGSFNGQRFAFTFTDPEFVNRNWRCVSLSSSEETFGLGGWPVRPTALVCLTPPDYSSPIKPRQCFIDRPGAANAETLNLFDLHWTTWTTGRATATGYDRGEHPGMIGSKPYRVRIVAFRPGTDPTTGGPMFTRITEYSSRTPHGHTVIPY